eukprot:1932506-Amphidinium_carterae.1
MYEPASGVVLLDGADVSMLQPSDLHARVAIVSQEPILFRGSLEHNICYGTASRPLVHRTWARWVPAIRNSFFSTNQAQLDERRVFHNKLPERDSVQQVAEVANAHDFIMRFPRGYAQEVGEHGVQLSGGQKQRIAIARAMMLQPQLLLLDEATSALDTASERLVQQALNEASKNRTTVVIAHRLSTVVNADDICVLEGGLLVEHGSHETLLQRTD